MDAVEEATPPPSSLSSLGLRIAGKDVSVGEYDHVTGLTYITRQRGRLHFHMGVNAVKTAAVHAADSQAASEDAGGDHDSNSNSHATDAAECEHSCLDALQAPAATTTTPPLRTGVFTGLALYPEEAYYLLQRGALVLFELASLSALSGPPLLLQPLSIAQFVSLLLRNQQASLACLDTYVRLKEHQFHPRRHARDASPRSVAAATTSTESSNSDASGAASSVLVQPSAPTDSIPRHFDPHVDSTCSVAFDVWKTSTETVYIPNTDHRKAPLERSATTPTTDTSSSIIESVARPTDATETCAPRLPQASAPRRRKDKKTEKRALTKRKVKRLHLAFRVVVCRFGDAAPSASALAPVLVAHSSKATARDAVDGSFSEDPNRLADSSAVPVKLAVVDDDRSVLFFEVA